MSLGVHIISRNTDVLTQLIMSGNRLSEYRCFANVVAMSDNGHSVVLDYSEAAIMLGTRLSECRLLMAVVRWKRNAGLLSK